MRKGDRARLKDGTEATITGMGIGDFIGDPFPVYLTTDSGGSIVLFSNELKARHTQEMPGRAEGEDA